MSAGLTIGVKIADSAAAILQRVKAFDQGNPQFPEEWDIGAHIGIDPMLLALSMELALKAWFVFDHNTPKVKRSHNLSKLFAGLTQESQNKLDFEFRRSVAPIHLNFFSMDYSITDVLAHHENAFVDWRYTHEIKTLNFHTSAFVATLEMVLSEFRKRYRTVNAPPPLGFSALK
tara:strand:+ start:3494 stop:4015 length:522 start_codon:yes stop_codon:yes gene_type:complete